MCINNHLVHLLQASEMFYSMLQMGSTTHKTEMSIIAGVLKGLAGCLVHFTQSAAEGTYQE